MGIREGVMSAIEIIQVSCEAWAIIFCIVIAISLYIQNKNLRDFDSRYIYIDLCIILILVFDIIAIVYRGNTSSIGYYMVRISNFFVPVFTYLMAIFFISAVDNSIDKPYAGTHHLNMLAVLFNVFGIVAAVMNIRLKIFFYFDDRNFYHRTSFWPLSVGFSLLSLVLVSIVIIRNRKKISGKQFAMYLSFMVLPSLMAFVQLYIYGLSLINISFVIAYIFYYFVYEVDKTLIMARQEKRIHEYNTKIMMTQVQPHFMFNTLNTIQYLCKNDPDMASETIEEFSEYLRNNIDFAAMTGSITFKKELGHVRTYVGIEKKRFGERINIEYNIEIENFLLPPFIVQPMVENAIKHGITKKKEGGTIILSTKCIDNNVIISVEDNGVGFDTEAPLSKDRVHVGLTNVRERIEGLCKGTMEVTSSIGEGTTVKIVIPLIKNND